MKFIVFFLFNFIFSNSLSEWLNLNKDIINSGSYKISFNQELQSFIAGSAHSNIDSSANIIFFKNKIRYENKNKIIIVSQNHLKLVNKQNDQIFIDHIDSRYTSLLKTDFIDLILDNTLISDNDNLYKIQFEGFSDLNVYMKNNQISMIKYFDNNMNIKISNIYISQLDTVDASSFFKVDNSSSSIFDLRNNK